MPHWTANALPTHTNAHRIRATFTYREQHRETMARKIPGAVAVLLRCAQAPMTPAKIMQLLYLADRLAIHTVTAYAGPLTWDYAEVVRDTQGVPQVRLRLTHAMLTGRLALPLLWANWFQPAEEGRIALTPESDPWVIDTLGRADLAILDLVGTFGRHRTDAEVHDFLQRRCPETVLPEGRRYRALPFSVIQGAAPLPTWDEAVRNQPFYWYPHLTRIPPEPSTDYAGLRLS